MPNIKSAKKRMVLSAAARGRNRSQRARIRTALKRVRAAETAEEGQALLRAVIKLLDQLGIPLVTTNYDDLIEKVTGLKPVTWHERRKISRELRGNDRQVFHLHGDGYGTLCG